MLSKKMHDALNAQINAELWSAYLYLSMSMDAASHGKKGLSNWMYVQWQEELDHARILELYLLSRDSEVLLQPIDAVPLSWDDSEEMLRESLAHEEEITASINDLMSLAQDERDYATIGRLRWFVDEQLEEEEQLRNMIQELRMINDDSYGEYEFDRQLSHRHYHIAEPLALI